MKGYREELLTQLKYERRSSRISVQEGQEVEKRVAFRCVWIEEESVDRRLEGSLVRAGGEKLEKAVQKRRERRAKRGKVRRICLQKQPGGELLVRFCKTMQRESGEKRIEEKERKSILEKRGGGLGAGWRLKMKIDMSRFS